MVLESSLDVSDILLVFSSCEDATGESSSRSFIRCSIAFPSLGIVSTASTIPVSSPPLILSSFTPISLLPSTSLPLPPPTSFHCRRGKAYLFNRSVNISMGPLEERMMLSGMHTVADIFCCCCGQNVGWKYESAHEKAQKYKEGKFVLERGRIVDEMDLSTEVYIDTRSDTEDS
ncbi:BnaC09g30290D [Brassica napus]|uniref:BnaC09g30290D protein n=1 Tax=Brassica napus TaxID=3708 RepID=A0A078G0X5_BRANA|nr:BnaC09g30290D [Brassica napus]